jgi:1,5-anhydro-D-fructose reductase (1,5-anhydro-D-mannitol-forming)
MRFINFRARWGIIGCGDVCETKSGPAFSWVPESSLIAVMRRDEEKAKDFATRHNVPKYYGDASDVINDPEINAIYVATPPSSHEAYAIEAMKAGKPVYIEKPVTISVESCQRMIDTSIACDVPVTVAHYRRGLPLFRRVKSLVENNHIGKIRLVVLNLLQTPKSPMLDDATENWRVNPALSGGGPFFDLAPHQLDILYWIFGTPRSIMANSINQGKNYEAPDVTTLSAVFGEDIVFQGLWSFNVSAELKMDSCKILGDKGTIEFPFFMSFEKANVQISLESGTTQEEFVFPKFIQQPMIEEVVNYFRGKGKNPCSLNEALVSLNMMELAMPAVKGIGYKV